MESSDQVSSKDLSGKKQVWDEVEYEGNVGHWGGLTAGQMADRFWWGLASGVYVGHGETLAYKPLADDDQARRHIEQVLEKKQLLMGVCPNLKGGSRYDADKFADMSVKC